MSGNVQKQMLAVLSHIANCSFQITKGKKTIAYSLTLKKLSCDRAGVKWAPQTTRGCAASEKLSCARQASHSSHTWLETEIPGLEEREGVPLPGPPALVALALVRPTSP